jgi:hypothetical protein
LFEGMDESMEIEKCFVATKKVPRGGSLGIGRVRYDEAERRAREFLDWPPRVEMAILQVFDGVSNELIDVKVIRRV